MGYFKLLLLFSFGFCLLLTTCKKPDCVKPEYPEEEGPCAGEHEVSAEFDVKSLVTIPSFGTSFVSQWTHPEGEEGMFLVLPTARFVALEDEANYQWNIGAGEYDTQIGQLSFSDADIGSIIPITLKVDKTPNLDCFPDDNGMDTITKYMKVIDRCDVPTLGRYLGAWKRSPLDVFELEIKYQMPDLSGCGSDDAAFLIGFLGDLDYPNDTSHTSLIREHTRYVAFGSPVANINDNHGFSGELWLDENLVDVIINYSIFWSSFPEADEVEQYTFIGKKIN